MNAYVVDMGEMVVEIDNISGYSVPGIERVCDVVIAESRGQARKLMAESVREDFTAPMRILKLKYDVPENEKPRIVKDGTLLDELWRNVPLSKLELMNTREVLWMRISYDELINLEPGFDEILDSTKEYSLVIHEDLD